MALLTTILVGRSQYRAIVAIVSAYGKSSYSGSAYIFTQSGGVWTEQQKLTASDGAAYDYFGWYVSISGDLAIVGAQGDDDNGSNSGSAYIFTQSGGVWSQTQKLIASDGAAGDNFGCSVSISGDVAIVGAYNDDDNGSSSGSAYIFTQSGGVWSQTQKLIASDGAADDFFGHSVSISGDVAILSAYRDSDNGSGSGSAYIFTQSGGVWTEQQKLTASDGALGDNFGYSVSISGDVAIVGAIYDNDNGSGSGSAYIFTQSGGVWTEQQKLTASDGAVNDWFGYSVSVSGDAAIVGALYDDDAGVSSGSAYIFEGPPSVPSPDTLTATTVSQNRIDLTWDGTSAKFRVLQKPDSSSADETDGTNIYEGSNKSFNVTGLDTNATYFFTVFGMNDAGTAFSSGGQKAAASTLPAEDSAQTNAQVGFLAGETDSTYSYDSLGVDIVITTGSSSDGFLELFRINAAPQAGNLPGSAESSGHGSITPSVIYDVHFWQVTNNGLTGMTYEIIISLEGVPGITDPTRLCVYKRSSSGDDWSDAAAGGATIAYNAGMNALIISGLSTFSEFAIGSDGGDNPLPVELSSFIGSARANGIQLNWTTQAETDNAGFVIYRNGVEIAGYENTASLKGHGTTSQSHSYAYADADVELNATYIYELISVDYSGTRHSYSQTVEVKVVDAITSGKPIDYALEQNYPNPFNPSTTITYTMKKAGVASIKVYDMLGRLVFEQTKASVKGQNQINFNGSKLTSGMYYYQLNAEGFSKTLKMMLVK